MKNPVLVTPITEIEWPEAAGNRIYLKRDDLQPYSLGGNKVRIAWEFLADLHDKGCSAMLMYGDLRSNLCRILAGMCRADGIPAKMIATEENRADSFTGFNETITAMFDIPVRTVEKDRIAEAVDEEMNGFRACGLKPYYIYGNRFGTGNEGVAARAYAKAYAEIISYERETGLHFDLIAVPAGTGATLGGMIAGAYECGDADRLLGFSISSRSRERALRILKETACGYFEGRGLHADPRGIEERIHLLTEYNLGGYGKIDARVYECVKKMMLVNSVAMAPEYSGKAFLGLTDFITEKNIRNKNILFLHTGGLPLFFDSLLRMQNQKE